MAKTIARLTIRRRWWVPLYLKALFIFIWCWALFADEDDMAELIEWEIAWVFERGYRVVLE